MQMFVKCLRTAASLLPLLVLLGCGSEDRQIEAGLGTVSAYRSAHPHYPVMAFDDFGRDNGPVGIPVDVYSFYCHATTQPNKLEDVSTAGQSSQQLAIVFAKAIESLMKLEASTPAPQPPYPGTPDWKLAPHPKPGTYLIVVKSGAKTRTFEIRCPVRSGESTAAALDTVRSLLATDATQVVTDHALLEKKELLSLKPPPGFTLATQEMLDVQQGSRGVEPHLIGDPLCLVPVDKRLAMAGLDHSIKKLLDATSHLNPAPQVAHLLINGPGFKGAYEISLSPGQGRDQAIASAELAVGSRLDELNRKAS